MTISPKTMDFAGNHCVIDGDQFAWNAMTNAPIAAALQPSLVAGTGDPTFSAAKGTLYIKIDATTTTTRLFINTNGSTTWTFVGTSGA